MLKNINANIFVAIAFFEVIPKKMSNGTVTRDVPPIDTVIELSRKEIRQAIDILIRSIFGIKSSWNLYRRT